MLETTDKFVIMKNLDEIDIFAKYMHKTYGIYLTEKLEYIERGLQENKKKNVIDIILEYSFFLIKKETSADEENYNTFITKLSPDAIELHDEIVMYCHSVPHFKESIQQHLIISALYTVKELCANKINYVKNIISYIEGF